MVTQIISHLPVCKKRQPVEWLQLFFLTVYCILLVIGWQNYFVWNAAQSIIGLLLLGYVIVRSRDKNKKSFRFFWPAILLFGLSIVIPARTFLYFALSCGLLFLIEQFFGKCGILPLVIVTVISPLFNYIFTVFTFPIKLQLSKLAAGLLSCINENVQAIGNVIRINGTDFSVDDACMGISMTGIGLLIGICLLLHEKQQTKVSLSFLYIFLYMCGLVLLLLSANVFRIVLLSQFRWLPGTFMHEVTGLLCFALYFVMPAILLTIWRINKHKKKEAGIFPGTVKEIAKERKPQSRYLYVRWMLYCFILVTACTAVQGVNAKVRDNDKIPDITVSLTGYQVSWASSDILKLYNENVLIYLKGIAAFYNSEHSPFICWEGSGYTFERVGKEVIAGTEVYSGELQQGNITLYTAWWFDNGTHRTIQQLDWRWKMLKGDDKYVIVNVSAASKKELNEKITAIIRHGELRQCIRAVADNI